MKTQKIVDTRTLAWGVLLFQFMLLNSANADELWERTEALVKQSQIWMPGAVETRQIVKDGKGDLKSENFVSMEIRKNDKTGEPEAHLLQLLEGEKDHTEKSRKEVEQEMQAELQNLERDPPFNLENPSDALTGKTDKPKLICGIACEGYRFEVSAEDEDSAEPMHFEGVVWVDPGTAVPLEIESHLTNLPHKLKDAEIASLLLKRTYSLKDGQLIPDTEEQELWINAKFLFKKLVFYIESATTYREHWYWKEVI